MILKKLELINFRSYEKIELEFDPYSNLFLGRNGSGKTNIIEAIGYLTTLKSHRVAQDSLLIRKGSVCSYIRAIIEKNSRNLLLELEINSGKSNRARINQVPQTRERDILGQLQRILFAPEDLELVKGDPSNRREYLDSLLVTRAPRLAGVMSDYERVLKQRNSLLKSAQGRKYDEESLRVWDEKLVKSGVEVISSRLHLVQNLCEPFHSEYAAVAPFGEATMRYRSSLIENEVLDPFTSNDDLIKMMHEAITREKKRELERGVSLVGPHRDELLLNLDGKLAKGYASHGESWSLALALKLAAYSLVKTDEPLLILDDVFAELDSKRRDALTKQLLKISSPRQLFITAAVVEDVPKEFRINLIQVGDDRE